MRNKDSISFKVSIITILVLVHVPVLVLVLFIVHGGSGPVFSPGSGPSSGSGPCPGFWKTTE